MTVLEYFLKGGYFMWPLLICSIVGVGIILERSIFILRNKIDEHTFKNEIQRFVRAGNYSGAQQLADEQPGSIAKITSSFFTHRLEKRRDQVLGSIATLLLEKEDKYMKVLSVIVHVAPLIGLLGTVAGLVDSFKEIEALGSQVKPSDLAGGIWAALMTTVFGLVVAIPCMIFYNWFESKVDYHARHMELMVSDLETWCEPGIGDQAGNNSEGDTVTHS